MSDFKTVYPNLANLDPGKRVNYTHGLVLGVDEFMQEQLYLLNKNRIHNASLHGYGTVYGLQIILENEDDIPRIKISPGMAIDPLGREICISLMQCTEVNNWLAREDVQADIEQQLSGSPPELELYVVLCYRECLTDKVPIPGGPCQTLEESSTASRIMDAFELQLRFEPPRQREEWAVRVFAALLKRIIVVDDADTVQQAQLEELVREIPQLLEQLETNASPPDPLGTYDIEQIITDLLADFFSTGSPAEEAIPIHPNDANQFLNSALLIWVTEIRPIVHAYQCSSHSLTQDAECLLLARLQFGIEQVSSRYQVVGSVEDWLIDQTERPYLLHSSLVQALGGIEL